MDTPFNCGIYFSNSNSFKMKTAYISLFLIFSTFLLQAQQISDGLRYSTDNNLGTARYSGMSGAMGALGGDLSAMETNPAGGAVFSESYSTFSVSHRNNQNATTYFGQNESSTANRFNINQAGGVFVFNQSNENSKLRKFTLGVNYNLQNNFNDEVFIAGRGNTSITEFFLVQAQGVPLDLLNLQSGESITSLYRYLGETRGSAVQNAFLGYQGFLFDPVDPDNPNNTLYTSNVAGDKFNQQYLYLSHGTNARFTINLAAQVSDFLYLGANINTHGFSFRQSDLFLESNNHSASYINRIGFENYLDAYGSGISVQMGAIARLPNNIRLGLSFDSPTWYQISEETSQYLETRRFEDGSNKTAVINPNVINVYEDYTLRTSAKGTISAAYIFDQNGLVSLDYSYKGYSGIRFSPSSDSYFKELNSVIKEELKGASILRAGGEYRLNRFSFRGGVHYEESPYKNDAVLGDLVGFSVGAGINFGYFNIDLAFRHSEQKSNLQMYSVGFTNSAATKSVYNNFILSLAYSM